MQRAARAAWWLLPPLACLLLYWYGFRAWFRADDFAWLGLGLELESWRDLPRVLFSPRAQGTIRPWSERLYFLSLAGAFGLDALPFRIVIFGTQFLNLALIQHIGTRLTGRRAVGLLAALLWVANSSQAEPLGWVSVYNQVMCAAFLLGAFYCLLRFVETGRELWWRLQWVIFLLGFGVLELNLVYPAIVLGYVLLATPKYWKRALWLWLPSLAYVVLHTRLAPVQKTGVYAMHFTGSVFKTLFTYWTWSIGPTFLWTPIAMPKWVLPAGIALVTLGLAAFLFRKLRGGERLVLFFPLWYLVTIAPLLPLRDHLTEYYVFIPMIGIAILGAWAVVEAWRAGSTGKTAAVFLVALYLFMTVPEAVVASQWNYNLTVRARNLVQGVATVMELHPRKTILLDGVDSDLFFNAFLDHPFRLLGPSQVYLSPGSENAANLHPEYGDPAEFILPADVAMRALERDELVVYSTTGPTLRNITSKWARQVHNIEFPARLDVSSPLTSYLLGPEWYTPDGNHRWMPKRASIRIAGPKTAAAKLYLSGNCPSQQFAGGPVSVIVSVDGEALAAQPIREDSFTLTYPLPAAAVGKPFIKITIEVDRSYHAAGDPRELGLAFGTFEVR